MMRYAVLDSGVFHCIEFRNKFMQDFNVYFSQKAAKPNICQTWDQIRRVNGMNAFELIPFKWNFFPCIRISRPELMLKHVPWDREKC